MQHVGCGDPHGIDLGVGDGLGPVSGRASKSEVAHGALAAIGLGVGADDKLRIAGAIGEQRRDAQDRA